MFTVPYPEVQQLVADLADAMTLGGAGALEAGYAVLDSGLGRVEQMGPGMLRDTLVERYRRALICYCELYREPSASLDLRLLLSG